ncbi:MarR family winged helix-turn-helix transcriptional regulator [Streptococcus dentiloxodontae]
MNNAATFNNLFNRVANKYVQWMNQPRSYGTAEQLTRSEIQIIAEIGNQPAINSVTLADKLGITKGAVTQMVQKLILKKLITKQKSTTNGREIVLKLTSDGYSNYQGWQKFHKETDKENFKLLEDMPTEYLNDMIHYFQLFEDFLETKIREES